MMSAWLSWARGPLFWGCLAIMILGLGRRFVLTLLELRAIRNRAGDINIPLRRVARDTRAWAFWRRGWERAYYSLTTVVFHVAILVAPLFLAQHIFLIERGLGLSWPALPPVVADALTLIAIFAGLALIMERLFARDARALSRFADYALLGLIIVVFLSGFLAGRPAWLPVSYEAMMFVHVMSANALFVAIPFSKVAHCALFPLTQLIAEMGWHFTPDAGSRMAKALGKENEPL